VRHFAAERAWKPFHSPKNLVMGLAEKGELMEHFLWVDWRSSRTGGRRRAKLSEVADEMADVAVICSLEQRAGNRSQRRDRGEDREECIKYPVRNTGTLLDLVPE